MFFDIHLDLLHLYPVSSLPRLHSHRQSFLYYELKKYWIGWLTSYLPLRLLFHKSRSDQNNYHSSHVPHKKMKMKVLYKRYQQVYYGNSQLRLV